MCFQRTTGCKDYSSPFARHDGGRLLGRPKNCDRKQDANFLDCLELYQRIQAGNTPFPDDLHPQCIMSSSTLACGIQSSKYVFKNAAGCRIIPTLS